MVALTLRVGDVFTIPLGQDVIGFGQIVHDCGEGHYYFAMFEGLYSRDDPPSIDVVLESEVALFALSLDALLYHRHWQVIDNREVQASRLPWPAYKEGTSPGAFDVVDYTGKHRRPATATETDELPFRTVVAPIRLEKALRALNGLGTWTDAYEELRPVSDGQTSSALLPNSSAH